MRHQVFLALQFAWGRHYEAGRFGGDETKLIQFAWNLCSGQRATIWRLPQID